MGSMFLKTSGIKIGDEKRLPVGGTATLVKSMENVLMRWRNE